MAKAAATGRKAGLAGVGADPRVYVIPDARVVFTALNKNACTALKWMVARIAGEDLNGFKAGLRSYTTDEEAVHNRNLWRHALTVRDVDPDVLAQIDPTNGWFIFAVVRDPRGRVFSAWQNKLLLDNAGYRQWRDEPWYPRPVFEPAGIAAEFARFVDALHEDPEHPLLSGDNHFRTQTRLLRLNKIRYTKIYDIKEIPALRSDLEGHLKAIDHPASVIMPRLNDTPLRATAAVFANGVREKVESIYADDFERFGESWSFASIESTPDWTEAALAEAELRATFGSRISDLHGEALALRDQLAEKDTRLKQLRERVAELEASAGNGDRRPRLRISGRGRTTEA